MQFLWRKCAALWYNGVDGVPWLGAGEGLLEVSGASVGAAEVTFEPAYL